VPVSFGSSVKGAGTKVNTHQLYTKPAPGPTLSQPSRSSIWSVVQTYPFTAQQPLLHVDIGMKLRFGLRDARYESDFKCFNIPHDDDTSLLLEAHEDHIVILPNEHNCCGEIQRTTRTCMYSYPLPASNVEGQLLLDTDNLVLKGKRDGIETTYSFSVQLVQQLKVPTCVNATAGTLTTDKTTQGCCHTIKKTKAYVLTFSMHYLQNFNLFF
jgi:hypothetical protein